MKKSETKEFLDSQWESDCWVNYFCEAGHTAYCGEQNGYSEIHNCSGCKYLTCEYSEEEE